MKIWMSRWVCRDVEANLEALARETAEAEAAGAEWVIFPESFLHGYTRSVDAARARATFERLSAAHPGVVLFAGSFTEDRRNRMTVWQAGRELARYDKIHLFPPNGELEIWAPGDHAVAVEVGGTRVGLLNCNDIRFPEQARALRLRTHCDVLVVVAWWPWRRDWIWRTLLQARAIENACWVAGCSVAASDWPGEVFAGAGNYVFDPVGEPVRTLNDHLYVLDPGRAEGILIDPLELAVPIDVVELEAASDDAN